MHYGFNITGRVGELSGHFHEKPEDGSSQKAQEEASEGKEGQGEIICGL